jgi:hypothetical protein
LAQLPAVKAMNNVCRLVNTPEFQKHMFQCRQYDAKDTDETPELLHIMPVCFTLGSFACLLQANTTRWCSFVTMFRALDRRWPLIERAHAASSASTVLPDRVHLRVLIEMFAPFEKYTKAVSNSPVQN